MKFKTVTFLFALLSIFVLHFPASAQLERIADETIVYYKSGTFAKPDVVRKMTRVALSQVRVHYKIVTTKAVETRDNGARVTVYLDGEMTNQDLQRLTDEFYATLQRKLGALGIGFADWNEITKTEYYNDRENATAEKNNIYADAGDGQAWVSFTAHNGPVFYRFNPAPGGKTFANELIGAGKSKKIAKMSEALDAVFGTLDVVVDFTAIEMATSRDVIWEDGAKYLKYGADSNVAAMMSVPHSYAMFMDKKYKFDAYGSALPVAERSFLGSRPYEDRSKAALKTRTIFGDSKFTFTPVVIDARRDLYLSAARRVLDLYADVFVEKMRLLRGGVKPGSQPIADTRGDGKTLKQVEEEARRSNDTTAVTYNELLAAGKEAEQKNNVRLAIEYYTRAIQARPDGGEAYLARLLANEKLKNWDAMIRDGEALLKLDPNNLLAKYAVGTAHFYKEDYKKASKILGEVAQAKPDFLEAVQNYALALAGTKKFDEAISILTDGIRRAPRYAGFYRARGIVYKIQGKAQLGQADELRAAQLERGQ